MIAAIIIDINQSILPTTSGKVGIEICIHKVDGDDFTSCRFTISNFYANTARFTVQGKYVYRVSSKFV